MNSVNPAAVSLAIKYILSHNDDLCSLYAVQEKHIREFLTC